MSIRFFSATPYQVTCLSLGILTALYSSPSLAVASEPTATLQNIKFYADEYSNDDQSAIVSHDSSIKVRQSDLLSNYLPTVTGVTVGGTSALDQHIYIRGVGSDNAGSALKITVDGVRQPETRGFHHAGISGLDPDLYKATEVAVGNNSVTLGNNAVGGAVAFTTVDAEDLLLPEQKIGARVKLGYASNDNQLHTALTTYAKPNDAVDLLVSYGERHSDGGEDGRGQHIQGDDITIKNILAKASFVPLQGHQFSASYQQYDNQGDYPFRPNVGYQRNLSYNIQDGYSTTESYQLGYDFSPSDTLEINSKLYHLENTAKSQGQRTAIPTSKMVIKTSGETDGISTAVKQKLTQARGNRDWTHFLNYGVEAYKKSATLDSSNITEDATSVGVYLQDRIDFGRVVLTPGVRFDHYKPSERLSKDDYNQVSGALAGEYRVTDDTTLFASYTQLFNGPPLPESIQQNGKVFINEDLKAETGANSEIGFSTGFDELLAKGDRLNFTAKYFNTDYDNKISRVTGIDCNTGRAIKDGQCAGFNNAGKTTFKGYELTSHYRLDKLLLTAGYAHAKSNTEQGYQLGKDSGDQFNIGFKYSVNDQMTLGSNIRHVDDLKRQTNATTVTYLPSFTTYDVFASYRPRQLPRLSLDAGVYNLSDAIYADHTSNSDDLAMGRNAKLSITYQF